MEHLLEDEPDQDRRDGETGDDDAESTEVLVVPQHVHEAADGIDRSGGVQI